MVVPNWESSSLLASAARDSCAGTQAARARQEPKPAASGEARGGSGGVCPVADQVKPRHSQAARTAACPSPDADSDLEAEQRVNAEMKERYRRLAESAALELASDGALAASCLVLLCGVACLRRGVRQVKWRRRRVRPRHRRAPQSVESQQQPARVRRSTLRQAGG